MISLKKNNNMKHSKKYVEKKDIHMTKRQQKKEKKEKKLLTVFNSFNSISLVLTAPTATERSCSERPS